MANEEYLAGQDEVRSFKNKTWDPVGCFNCNIPLRWTLDQYSVNADTVIHFTPMHKTLRFDLIVTMRRRMFI